MAYYFDRRHSRTASADGWAVFMFVVLAILLVAWLAGAVVSGRGGSADGFLAGKADHSERLLNSPQRSRMRP